MLDENGSVSLGFATERTGEIRQAAGILGSCIQLRDQLTNGSSPWAY